MVNSEEALVYAEAERRSRGVGVLVGASEPFGRGDGAAAGLVRMVNMPPKLRR